MALKIVTHAERPDLNAAGTRRPTRSGRTSCCNDAIVDQYWGGLRRHFPDCQLYLLDDQTDTLVGLGNTVPVTWDGTTEGLPGGIDDVLTRAIGGHETAAAAEHALRAPGGAPARAIRARG